MADPRVFTLIGNFDDHITPALAKINKSLEQVKANLESVSKATKPLKSDFKELADLSGKFSGSLKSQAADIRDVTQAMRAMRNEMGRVNRAYRAGRKNRGIAPPPPPPPRTPRFAAPPPPPRTPRFTAPTAPSPRGPGGGQPPFYSPDGRRGRSGSFAAAAGGFVAGSQLAEMMTGSIVKGFQLGVSIMQKPFQYAANAFGERIRDEMTDIQSAGGLFATDLRKNLGLFKDFQQARIAQEAINYRLAKSAAALPGSTAEYVQEAKKITDTMINAMAKQPEQFVKLGQDFGAKAGDKMDALGAVIQRFTEKAVLLGKGSGGQSRMYGMPQLLEMMVNMPRVNVQGMQKYSVLRGNPMLQAALLDAEKQINATGAGTADRLRELMKVLDAALPNEVVQGMRNSMDGIIEVIRSSFLDPEVGLFGLGRKMKAIGPAVDQYGRLVDEQGKVVNDLSKAAKADLSLFAILRDVIGGFALPLGELAQILPELFDPLRKVGESMVRMRNVAQRFYANFNQYTAEFEALAKEVGGKKGLEIKRTAGARGALLSVANLLRGTGAIDMSKYEEVAKKLQAYKPDLGAITGDLIKTLFSSDMMRSVGEAIGGLFGSVIKMVGDLMEGATDFATAGPFANGLKQGWDAAKGSEGVAKVFRNLFKIIGDVIVTAFKSAPFEMSVLTALTVGMPLITGAITAGLTALFETLLRNPKTLLQGVISFLTKRKVAPVNVQDMGSVITDPRRMLPAAPETALATTTKVGPLAKGMGAFGKFFISFGNYVKGVGPRFIGFFKGFLGKLTIFGGVLTSIISLFQGKDLAQSLAEGAGPVLGAALGAALIPFLGPIGPMIGAAVGGWVGSLEVVTKPLAEAFNAIGGTLGPTVESLGSSLQSIVNILGSAVMGVVGAFVPLNKEVDQATAIIIAIKIALTPIVAAFQLIEQVVNLLAIGLKGLELAVLYARRGLAQLNPFGSEEKRRRLDAEIGLREQELNQANARVINAFKRHQEWYKTETKTKPIAASSVPSAQPGKRVSGLKPTAADMAWYNSQKTSTPAPSPQTSKRVSGLTPSAADMAWYNQQKALLKNPQSVKTPPAVRYSVPTVPAPPSKPTQIPTPKFTPSAKTPGVTTPPSPQLSQTAAAARQTAVNTSQIQQKTTASVASLGNIRAALVSISTKISGLQTSLNATLQRMWGVESATYNLLVSGALRVQTNMLGGFGGMGGAMFGTGIGDGPGIQKTIAAGKVLQGMGLNVAENPAFGTGRVGQHAPNSYHYAGRAIDVTGPPALLDQAYAKLQGTNPAELLWRVPGHYDHLHVAYALGPNMPAFFGSQSSAINWENSMVPGSVKVASVTGNSAEGFGGSGPVTVNAPITIHQQPGQNAEELASIVAIKIGEAVAQARSSSVFV